MTAPSIPDLRTLLRANRPSSGQGSSRVSGRGRGRGAVNSGNITSSSRDLDDIDFEVQSAHSTTTTTTTTKDRIVQQTDRDATLSRVSAVESGYLEDPFARCFLEPGESVERRFPIMNRGTFVRTYAIDLLVEKFLASVVHREDTQSPKQIISLGAGSDTRWFRLVTRSLSSPSSPETTSTPPKLIYHELDFPANTSRKIASIQRSDLLRSTLHSFSSPIQISEDATRLFSSSYNIHPVDLRTLSPPTPFQPSSSSSSSSNSTTTPTPPLPTLPNINPNLPTLLISECCLIYLSPSSADAILRYFTTHLFPSSTPLGIILYEPIRPFDAFGTVMQQNLARRGIELKTLHRYSSLKKQRERLRTLGFETGQGAVDVDFAWLHWVLPAERERVDALEMLDEVEEWRLLGGHYCVGWGFREHIVDDDDDDDDDDNKHDDMNDNMNEGEGEGASKDEKGRRRMFTAWEELPRPESDDVDIDK